MIKLFLERIKEQSPESHVSVIMTDDGEYHWKLSLFLLLSSQIKNIPSLRLLYTNNSPDNIKFNHYG